MRSSRREFRPIRTINELEPGDIVRHKSQSDGGKGYVVTDNDGQRATGVRTIGITNPDEWEVLETLPEKK